LQKPKNIKVLITGGKKEKMRRYRKIGSCIGGRTLSFNEKLSFAGLEFIPEFLGDSIIYKGKKISVDLIKISLSEKGYNVYALI